MLNSPHLPTDATRMPLKQTISKNVKKFCNFTLLKTETINLTQIVIHFSMLNFDLAINWII